MLLGLLLLFGLILFVLGWFFYLPWVLRRAIFAILKCFYKENLIYFNRSFNKIRLNHLYCENIDDFLKLVQLIIRSWKKKSTWKVELKFYFNQRKSMVRAWFTSLQSVLLVSTFCPWNVIMKAKWLARKKKKKKKYFYTYELLKTWTFSIHLFKMYCFYLLPSLL